MKKYLRTGKLLIAPVILTAAMLVSGCGNSENFVFTNTALPQPGLAPVAVNDAYPALGNATITQTAAGGVLANDTLNGGNISGFDATGSEGGTPALNADGSYSYTPAANFVGAETFTYTLSNAGGNSSATVTFTSTGKGIFVDNSTDATGDGSQADPFDTLAEGLAIATPGDTIVVLRGTGTSTGLSGAIALPQGVDLIGEGTGVVLAQTVLPAGQPPVITGPVNCGGDNVISGFVIDGSAGAGIVIPSVGDVTISNNTISDPTLGHILGVDVTGTVTISDNTLTGPPNAVDFINIENTSVNATLSVTGNVFTNDAMAAVGDVCEVVTLGTSVVNTTFSGNIASAATTNFNFGFVSNCTATSTQAVTVTDNQFRGFTQPAILLATTSDLSLASGTISGNSITAPFQTGISVQPSGGTTRISGNTLSGASVVGVSLQTQDSDSTIIVENNTITDTLFDGLSFFDSDTGNYLVALRNNQITNSGTNAVNVNWAGANSLCMEFTGNNFNDLLTLNNSGAGTFNVEDLSNLDTINDLNSIAPMLTNITEASCNIP